MSSTGMCTASASRRWTVTEASAVLIVKLQPADLAQLQDLLQANQLPGDDCAEQLPALFGVFDQERMMAAGGLEVVGEYGLLRSIVVDSAYRGQGLATAITEFLLAEAERRGLHGLYLLTETAESYFTRFGFARVARSEAPAGIIATRQFADLCPDNASFMRLHLDPR